MAILVLYCLITLLALHIIAEHLLNKFRNLPPSPFPCLPIIGHLHLLKQPIYRTLSRIADRHGPVFFLKFGTRQVLVVSSPSAAEECFTKNDITFANRPNMLVGEILNYNFTTILWASYGDLWRNLRRIAALEILSTNRLQMLYSIRRDEIKQLLSRLFKNQNQTVDMRKELFELTLNNMMRMIAGKRYYGDNVPDAEEAKRFRAIQAESLLLGGKTNIGDFLPWMRSKKLEKSLIELARKRDEFMQDLVEQYRRKSKEEDCSRSSLSPGDRKRTMVQVLLSLQEKEPEYYTDEIIKGLMLTLLLAGTDTTINTTEWALSLLVNHPQVLKKAQAEIDKQVGHGRLIDERDLTQLPYLRCVINETMRMYPPVPTLIPHQSSQPCSIGGFHIPKGTMLFVNAWAIQNDPKVWPDPAKFMPERFEGLDRTKVDFRLMPFGYGRRSCPGDGLGLKVVGLALGSLIQSFELEILTGENAVDMTEGAGVTLGKAKPLKVTCRPRPHMINLLSHI